MPHLKNPWRFDCDLMENERALEVWVTPAGGLQFEVHGCEDNAVARADLLSCLESLRSTEGSLLSGSPRRGTQMDGAVFLLRISPDGLAAAMSPGDAPESHWLRTIDFSTQVERWLRSPSTQDD